MDLAVYTNAFIDESLIAENLTVLRRALLYMEEYTSDLKLDQVISLKCFMAAPFYHYFNGNGGGGSSNGQYSELTIEPRVNEIKTRGAIKFPIRIESISRFTAQKKQQNNMQWQSTSSQRPPPPLNYDDADDDDDEMNGITTSNPRSTEITVFMHCRPKTVDVTYLGPYNLYLFSDFNNLDRTVLNIHALEYMAIRDLIPEYKCSNRLWQAPDPTRPQQQQQQLTQQQLNESNALKERNGSERKVAYVPYQSLASQGLDLNNKWVNTRIPDESIVIEFKFNEPPLIQRIQDQEMALFTPNQLLEFKRFMLKFILYRQNQNWCIKESRIVYESLFKTLLQNEYMANLYLPNAAINYWFAIPTCFDPRDPEIQLWNKTVKHHILQSKALIFQRNRNAKSYEQPFFSPILTETFHGLLNRPTVAGPNGVIYKKAALGFKRIRYNQRLI